MDELHKQGEIPTSKRVVLYARVSSDDRGKDGRNLQGQLEMCREYAQERGWPVVAELAEDDRGASGASFELPKLNQVLEMAQADDFDILVVRELDRLSRNLAKQLIVEEELNRYGVGVEYALAEYPDTPEGRLNKHIRATVAEYEREKIIERTSRARRLNVKAGNVMVFGRAPYGYRVDQENGKTVLVIHESEARIVHLIYTWYTAGDGDNSPMGIADITRKLTEMCIPTRADTDDRWRGTKKRKRCHWNRGSVYRMLKSETYAGVWYYGKRTRENGVGRCRPRDSWLAVEVPNIVTRELWDAAQARLAENRESAGRRARGRYLVSRRVVCGKCGLRMTGSSTIGSNRKRYVYYRCPAAYQELQAARDCDAPSFRAQDVDAAVWGWAKSFLTHPEALEHGLWEHHQELERQNTPIRERLAVVDDLLAENRAQLERLLDLYLAGDFPKEMLTERKGRLEKTILALEKEQAGLVAHLEARLLTVDQIRSIQEFAAKVGEKLGAMDDDFEVKRRLIEELDVRATLTVENDEHIVHVQCVLGKQSFCVLSDTTRPMF